MNGKIAAVIPVRAGSTRIKNKNMKPFAGTTLLENKICQLKQIDEIDEIIVSSDSEEMLETALRYQVSARKRPVEYCDEKSRSFNEVVRYIAAHEVQKEIMMWVPCVCPLVFPDKIREGIGMYQRLQQGELEGDSVATAALIKEYLFDETGPVNFSVEHHVPSQKLPKWHYITNGFFIARTEDMARWGFVYGKHPVLCEVNKCEAIDIDDDLDFWMAEMIFEKIQKEANV